jgi:2-amino-4-hydroxy-6-hydroxymethyldihydropteridine diphosphokinase
MRSSKDDWASPEAPGRELENGNIAYISIGSNLGDRAENLNRAVAHLDGSDLTVTEVSPFYSTEPVGFQDQPWFLNAAVSLETDLSPMELLKRCRQIEDTMGRVRTFRDAPRTVDLDILLFGNRIIDRPDLQIPHPRMAERRFVLKPLSRIAPEAIHPVLGKDIRSLLAACPDTSAVLLYRLGDST